MSYFGVSAESLDYAPCRYGESRLVFRGPKRRVDVPFVAFLGGNDTYGKFIKAPFPALVESDLGVNCINFGILNAGIDVFLKDAPLLEIAGRAEVTVIQLIGAQNLSNRFYSVHPRRNDRFLSASDSLCEIFPEVDFAEFHFNKHMLSALHKVSRERFATVRQELQTAWLARMKTLIGQIPGKVVLAWFADHPAHPSGSVASDPAKARDPLFVTREMLEELRGDVCDLVDAEISPDALAAGTEGMVFDEIEALAAQAFIGPRAHGEFAAKLSKVLFGLV